MNEWLKDQFFVEKEDDEAYSERMRREEYQRDKAWEKGWKEE